MLIGFTSCSTISEPVETQPFTETPATAPAEQSTPITNEALTEAATEETAEPLTDAATEAPTEAATEAITEPAAVVPQVADLVGTWQRTYTEVEGDRNENNRATLTITEGEMAVTYKDREFPDTNFKNKPLTVKEGELYLGCDNGSWYAEVAPTGRDSYCLTLLTDGSLLLQCGFDFDGQPMVSYQWVARSE